jgi:hypothetical protein
LKVVGVFVRILMLSLALASLGVATSLTAQHMYALTPYAFYQRFYN